MKVTAESTEALEQRLRFLLPAADQAYLFALDAQVQAKRAKDAARAARMRAAKTKAIEDRVHAAIYAKRSTLERKDRCNWTSSLMEHFERTGAKAPDEEVVRRIVKEFPGF